MIKLPFSKTFSEDVTIKGNNDILLNLERIWIMSIGIMIWQIINYSDRAANHYPVWAQFLMFAGSFAVFTSFIKLLRNSSQEAKTANRITAVFWMCFVLFAVPFVAADIRYENLPMSAVLTAVFFTMVPIFRGKTENRMLGFCGVVLGIVGLSERATVPYYLYVLLAGVVGKMLSQHIHYNYRRMIEKLSDETKTDFLTGILNRRGGFERAETDFSLCVRHRQIYVVYMIDIDFFKDYNDTFGHYMGDAALIAVAECIGKTFARKSDIHFRYGGEEFAACISVDREETVKKLAENLRVNVENLMIKAGKTTVSPYLTVSIGATAYIPDKTPMSITETDLFEKADEALYKAKEGGRNRTEYLEMN